MDTLGLGRNTIIAIIVILVFSSTFSMGIVHQITPGAAQQFSMANRILLDNSEGNVIGWNPNGNRMSFTIFDEQFNPDQLLL